MRMNTLSCPEVEQLKAFAFGTLVAAEGPVVGRHLQECPVCAALVAELSEGIPHTQYLGATDAGSSADSSPDTLPPGPPSRRSDPTMPNAFPFLHPSREPDEIGRIASY